MPHTITVPDELYSRLEALARPFVDREPADVIQRLNRSTHRWHTLGSVRCAHGYVALSLFVRLAHATQGWPEICVYESLVV